MRLFPPSFNPLNASKLLLEPTKVYYYAHLLDMETAAYTGQRTCPNHKDDGKGKVGEASEIGGFIWWRVGAEPSSLIYP